MGVNCSGLKCVFSGLYTIQYRVYTIHYTVYTVQTVQYTTGARLANRVITVLEILATL